MGDTPKRYGQTAKKLITLTHEGREQIQNYADEKGFSFSATIETLALIGLKADLTTLLIPLLGELVEGSVKRQVKRLVKLSALSAAESAMAHNLSTMLLLQSVRQEAVAHPQDFEARLPVSTDPANPQDFRIREMYNRLRHSAVQRKTRLIKQPVQELLAELLAEAPEAVSHE